MFVVIHNDTILCSGKSRVACEAFAASSSKDPFHIITTDFPDVYQGNPLYAYDPATDSIIETPDRARAAELEALKSERLSALESELRATDIYALTDYRRKFSPDSIAAMDAYREAVRQLNHRPDFPWLGAEIPWPEKPEMVKINKEVK